MPKVKYENSKGLYQSSGSGFEIIDGHIKPACDINRVASIQATFAAETGVLYQSLYFDISDNSKDYRVWFDVDSAGSAPSAVGRTLVEVDVPSGGRTARQMRDLVVSALEAAGNFLCGDAAANGTITIFTTVPAPMTKSFSAGTATSLITVGTITNGAGKGSYTLGSQKVHVLQCAPFNTGNEAEGNHNGSLLSKYTLGDGTYTGQEKIIIRDDTVATNGIIVTAAKIYRENHAEINTTTDVTFTAQASSAVPRILHLIWAGAAWVVLNAATGGSAMHGNGGTTGNNA